MRGRSGTSIWSFGLSEMPVLADGARASIGGISRASGRFGLLILCEKLHWCTYKLKHPQGGPLSTIGESGKGYTLDWLVGAQNERRAVR